MRLTMVLLKRITRGSMFSGKDRVLVPVKLKDRVKLYERLAREEEAMFYLSRPYLTEEQEKHLHHKNDSKKNMFEETRRRIDRRRQNIYPHRRIEDLMLRMRYGETWE